MLKIVIAALAVPVSLTAMAASGIAEPGPATPAEGEQRICRNMSAPGKLAGRRRICMTKAEWDRSAEEHRRAGQAWITAQDSCRTRAEPSEGSC